MSFTKQILNLSQNNFFLAVEMEKRMVADGWDDRPEIGDNMRQALTKVFSYIDWLRDGKNDKRRH